MRLVVLLSLFVFSACDKPPIIMITDNYPPTLPPFYEAVDEDDIEQVKEYLSKGACTEDIKYPYGATIDNSPCYDINLQLADGRTFMFYVKSLEMANLLLSKGADLSLRDMDEATALHYADNPETAKFFLDQGLDIEAKDKSGETPLYRAIADDRIDTAEFLFEQGANPHARTDLPSTPRAWLQGKTRWYTFRLNRLLKRFKAYEEPADSKPKTSELTEENPTTAEETTTTAKEASTSEKTKTTVEESKSKSSQ